MRPPASRPASLRSRDWYGDTMSEDTRHGENAPGTWKFQVTFRGSVPEDVRLGRAVKARATRDGIKYADVVRAALVAYLDL